MQILQPWPGFACKRGEFVTFLAALTVVIIFILGTIPSKLAGYVGMNGARHEIKNPVFRWARHDTVAAWCLCRKPPEIPQTTQ